MPPTTAGPYSGPNRRPGRNHRPPAAAKSRITPIATNPRAPLTMNTPPVVPRHDPVDHGTAAHHGRKREMVQRPPVEPETAYVAAGIWAVLARFPGGVRDRDGGA
ncbi:hypothetical protein GCM10022420_008760 [Streptomyces iranensis]